MATIIDFFTGCINPAARIFKGCMKEKSPEPGFTLVNTECPCDGCREFFAAHRASSRSTTEIMNDLRPLAMIGEQGAEKRDALMTELAKAIILGKDDNSPKGAA